MAYGNFYGYPFPQQGAVPDVLNQYKMPYQTPAQTQNGLLWVQGEQAAKSYLVAPGNTVVLWDSENPYIYIKTADVSGMPSTKILEYKEHTEPAGKSIEHTCSCGEKFVDKDDFKALSDKVDALAAKIEKGAEENV